MFHEYFAFFGAAGLELYKILETVLMIYLIGIPCIVKQNLNPLPDIFTPQNYINGINLV